MEGGTRVRTDSTMSWIADGLSTRHDSTRTVRTLLSEHWGCGGSGNNPFCPYAGVPAPISVQLAIDWPYPTAFARVTVNRIDAAARALTGPIVESSLRVAVVNHRLVVTLPAVTDGNAYDVVTTGTA